MALTPVKPSFYGSIGNAKFRVWYTPTIATSTAETFTVPGIKRVFQVTNARTGTVSWTSSQAANGLGSVVTMVITASSTGTFAPVMVVGY